MRYVERGLVMRVVGYTLSRELSRVVLAQAAARCIALRSRTHLVAQLYGIINYEPSDLAK